MIQHTWPATIMCHGATWCGAEQRNTEERKSDKEMYNYPAEWGGGGGRGGGDSMQRQV